MVEDKLSKMEEMFLQTSKPKIILKSSKDERIKKLGSVFDTTKQGENALNMATALAKALDVPLKVFAVDDFHSKLTLATEEIRDKQLSIHDKVKNHAKEEMVAAEIEDLLSPRMEKILKFLEQESVEEDKLSTLMLEKIQKENFSLFIAGSPMLRSREEKGYFGFYLRKLLEDHNITSDFILIPNEIADRSDTILGISNYRQKQGTSEAVIKRAMSLKKWKNNILMIGIVEENTIETVARAELPDAAEDTRANIAEVKERIIGKFKDHLNSFQIDDDEIDLKTEVNVGVITAVVKLILDKYKPSLVIVRNVSKFDQNLDGEAETIARISLSEGYPILLNFEEATIQ